jgi:hypothetical protein
MKLYETLCNNETYATVCNYMQLYETITIWKELCNYMKLYENMQLIKLYETMQLYATICNFMQQCNL